MATEEIVARQTEQRDEAGAKQLPDESSGNVDEALLRINRALPDLAKVLVEQATKGSASHLKMAFELGGVEKRTRKTKAKPAYDQHLERQLLQECEEIAARVRPN